MTLTHRFLAVLLAVLAASLPALAQDERDVVQLHDGKVDMSVEAENWDAVVGKGSKPILWDDIKTIDYADAADFTKAVETFKSGNHGAALTQFDTLEQDPKLRKVFKQQIAFHRAFALQKAGNHDEAIAAFQNLIETYPKGRYHVRAADRLVTSLLAKKDKAGAVKAVDGLIAAAGDPVLAAALGLISGQLLLDESKWAEARKFFDAAVAAPGVPAWVRMEGQLGQASCGLGEGNAKDAELRLRSLTVEGTTSHVLAGAWNGLGDIYSAQGRDKKDIDKLIDALYCYLRGVTVYAPLAGEPTDQYERALAGASTCFGYVADLEPNKDRKSDYRKRSNERKELLKKDFPFSRYLKP